MLGIILWRALAKSSVTHAPLPHGHSLSISSPCSPIPDVYLSNWILYVNGALPLLSRLQHQGTGDYLSLASPSCPFPRWPRHLLSKHAFGTSSAPESVVGLRDSDKSTTKSLSPENLEDPSPCVAQIWVTFPFLSIQPRFRSCWSVSLWNLFYWHHRPRP